MAISSSPSLPFSLSRHAAYGAAERISDPSYGAKTEDKGRGTEIRRRWSWWKRMYTQVRAFFIRALREARGITAPPLLYRPRTHRHAYNHTNMRIRAQFIIIKRAMERHAAACALLSRQLCTAMPHLPHWGTFPASLFLSLSPSPSSLFHSLALSFSGCTLFMRHTLCTHTSGMCKFRRICTAWIFFYLF